MTAQPSRSDALGMVLPTRMHERVIYAETFAHGKTALEIDPKAWPHGSWPHFVRPQGKDGKQEFMKGRIYI